ncbi:RND family transporter [Nibricoccus sp. IMCC34717]|uniref:efflux RND transporter permease subunit n=1 Tax=Nibricoccus sp. IMCC34717 TaxID=3034021 RepID=UPI00384FD5F7
MIAPLISRIEKLVFGHRTAVVVVFGLLALLFALAASRTHVDASFTKQLPLEHPYLETFVKHREQAGGANRVLIALLPRNGDIFTAPFFDLLKRATDEVFFLPGIDRSQVQSIFTPGTRYLEVVEDGFAGGPVVPSGFEPTEAGFAEVRANLVKSGKVGQIVANDFRGAMISAQLLDVDPATGKQVDPTRVAQLLEDRIRDHFEGEIASVHIIGFAKVVGDVKRGAVGVIGFFGISLAITLALLWVYSSALKLTWPPIACSLISVVWQMGLLNLCGFGIDPFSLLVPFLIFAMAVSHGVQMVRAYRSAVFDGATGDEAAREAFRQLMIPGGVALISDLAGFLTILVIKIQAIQEMAISASLGVAAVILTNLFLLPVLLSFQHLKAHYRAHITERRRKTDEFWRSFCHVMRPTPSLLVLLASVLLGIFAWRVSQEIRIGDSQAGVPELRPESRYNQDSRAITGAFSIGVDVLTVIAEGKPNACVDHSVLTTLDQLEHRLRLLPGVQSVTSLATVARTVNSAWNEGSLKWRILPINPQALAQAVSPVETSTGLLNADGSVLPVFVFLRDHKAETLSEVVRAVKDFSAGLPAKSPISLHLASGNAGVMAATNEVVERSQNPILAWVFGVVTLLCLLTFRSWRATVCIMLPLALVSWLSYAVMVFGGIGLKVTTLPVVALGAGIGVDYGIYLFARLQEALERGDYFEDAMYAAFTQAGSSIVFTALTLALGVGLWAFSAIQFQADMGLLLAFLFSVNMLGAVVLMPAIARWLYRHHTRKDPVV